MPQAKDRSGFRKRQKMLKKQKGEVISDSPNKEEWVKKLEEREKEQMQQVLEDTETGTLKEAQERALERLKADLDRRSSYQESLDPQDRVIKKEPQDPKTLKAVQMALQQVSRFVQSPEESKASLKGRISSDQHPKKD